MEEIPMKRIAFAAAAAALLGTGCISSSPPPPPPPSGAVDVGWSFIRYKADFSTVTYGCDVAGVDSVLVTFQVDGPVQVACKDAAGDGAFIQGISPGTQTFTVTGRRGGVALFSSAPVTVTVAVGQTTSVPDVQAHGIQDDLAVYANFLGRYGGDQGWASCYLANVSTLDYVIADYANTVVASGTVSCTDPAGISFIGASALDRDNYVIRMRGFAPGQQVESFDSATTALAPTCDGQAFDHLGQSAPNPDAWDVLLFDTTLNSTVCP
jgi:hypothetical protein